MAESIDKFIEKLRTEKFDSEEKKAEECLQVIEQIISDGQWLSLRELIDHLNFMSTVLQTNLPWDTTPYNMVKRVLKIISDEYIDLSKPSDSAAVSEVDLKEIRDYILELLSESKAEIEQCHELIAIQGENKIHSDEIILTCDFCPNVFGFLTRAAKKRRFHVIVAEGAPNYKGHKMAKWLSEHRIKTTLIEDCAIFSLMSRVNKVIIGCRTVFFNGGIKTFVGAAALAAAAKYYSVPLYVCTTTYQFCPEMSEEVSDFTTPEMIESRLGATPKEVNVAVSLFDYVSPENVTSFITNNRGIAPIYVYRQIRKLYHPSESTILGSNS